MSQLVLTRMHSHFSVVLCSFFCFNSSLQFGCIFGRNCTSVSNKFQFGMSCSLHVGSLNEGKGMSHMFSFVKLASVFFHKNFPLLLFWKEKKSYYFRALSLERLFENSLSCYSCFIPFIPLACMIHKFGTSNCGTNGGQHTLFWAQKRVWTGKKRFSLLN